ncbi:hypothetical protein EGH21_16505 [Halomicroarcula sp. F13]|uniref:Uncharacterized protein n=1 Tax=Haloarcula rubra TaxID=2487747 RepID=A0AAW4PVI4_9EURY|nr:hypothetical protein [Halomicroarcula rubra]MBX0324631.1 hypothetical protein [Halomicroarcula rubra]
MDRERRARSLAEALTDRPEVADAWTAKSFTDRLLVVECDADKTLPASVVDRLRAEGFVGAEEAYDIEGAADAAFAGRLEDAHRYRFVDTESRGEHRSYVVE